MQHVKGPEQSTKCTVRIQQRLPLGNPTRPLADWAWLPRWLTPRNPRRIREKKLLLHASKSTLPLKSH